jgi:hypothetical protein
MEIDAQEAMDNEDWFGVGLQVVRIPGEEVYKVERIRVKLDVTQLDDIDGVKNLRIVPSYPKAIAQY